MAKKEIYFDNVRVGFATKATVKKELATEETDTFDGKLVDSDPNPAVTVSIDSVRAGTTQQYIDLEKKLKYAQTNPITVQIVENIVGQDGKEMVIKDFAYNGVLSTADAALEPTARTALSIEIKAQSHKRFINGTEI